MQDAIQRIVEARMEAAWVGGDGYKNRRPLGVRKEVNRSTRHLACEPLVQVPLALQACAGTPTATCYKAADEPPTSSRANNLSDRNMSPHTQEAHSPGGRPPPLTDS